jgi:hypothetical protein
MKYNLLKDPRFLKSAECGEDVEKGNTWLGGHEGRLIKVSSGDWYVKCKDRTFRLRGVELKRTFVGVEREEGIEIGGRIEKRWFLDPGKVNYRGLGSEKDGEV